MDYNYLIKNRWKKNKNNLDFNRRFDNMINKKETNYKYDIYVNVIKFNIILFYFL